MKVFFDNNFSRPLVKIINRYCKIHGKNYLICHLQDRFEPNVPDKTWIKHLASEGGWTVITLDRAITRRGSEERKAMQNSKLRFLFCPSIFVESDKSEQKRIVSMRISSLLRQLRNKYKDELVLFIDANWKLKK